VKRGPRRPDEAVAMAIHHFSVHMIFAERGTVRWKTGAGMVTNRAQSSRVLDRAKISELTRGHCGVRVCIGRRRAFDLEQPQVQSAKAPKGYWHVLPNQALRSESDSAMV
jgi:hypothetical protein